MTSLSILIAVGALLCACNGVWGYWLPTSEMAAPSNLDGEASGRKSTPQYGIPLNVSVTAARTHLNDVHLSDAVTKTQVRSSLAGSFSDSVVCLRTPTTTRFIASLKCSRPSGPKHRAAHAARHGDLVTWTALSEDRNQTSCTYPSTKVSTAIGKISAVSSSMRSNASVATSVSSTSWCWAPTLDSTSRHSLMENGAVGCLKEDN